MFAKLSLALILVIFICNVKLTRANVGEGGFTEIQAKLLEKFAIESPSWNIKSSDAYGLVNYNLTNQKLSKIEIPPAGLFVKRPDENGIVRFHGENIKVEFTMQAQFTYADYKDANQLLYLDEPCRVAYKMAMFNYQAQVLDGELVPLPGRITVSLMKPTGFHYGTGKWKLTANEFNFSNGLLNINLNIKFRQAMLYASTELAKRCPDAFLKGDTSAPCKKP